MCICSYPRFYAYEYTGVYNDRDFIDRYEGRQIGKSYDNRFEAYQEYLRLVESYGPEGTPEYCYYRCYRYDEFGRMKEVWWTPDVPAVEMFPEYAPADEIPF